MAYFINRVDILHKENILSRQYVSPNLFFEQVLTQLMTCQGFPAFLWTKYSNFLHFQCQCGRSVIYYKYSKDSIYDYLETSIAPTILIIETQPNNPISPNVALSDFPLLENPPTTQERTMTPNNAAVGA